jgi:hypothetical protein
MRTLNMQGCRRWLGGLSRGAIALAGMAVIGAATLSPAQAQYWDHRWHHHHSGGVGFGFSVGTPGYGYYPYPAYPAYGYPYYGGYPYYYGGPSVSFSFGHR